MQTNERKPREMMSPGETARLLGVSVATLSSWRSRYPGKLPFVKYSSNLVRYKRSDVEAFIAGNRIVPAEGE